ncbi:Imm52 family immunity protein [Photorhabdus australis]|uniref:Imm52 family immunity protein n=1 Tax=Photorhabdus australis TaxID=286156 RepID=UPI000692492D|nr:Imm52 family immunity protein [Photorhabdus australis]
MSELSFSIQIKENVAKDFTILCGAFSFFLKEINKCNKSITTLYAKGETLEDALQHKIIDLTGVIHSDAEKLIGKNLPYAVGLWNGDIDKGLSIMIMDEVDRIETYILIGAENHIVYNKNNLVDFIKSVADKYTLQYCSISFNGKGTGDKVFPDRPAVGWMIYLPVHIEEGYLNIAEDVIPVSTELNTGTIIVSKNEYHCLDKADQQASNDLEIILADLGILPLYSEMK